MRAAAAALSVAAYHELNTDRMGKAAPGLIRVLVGLLPHPDAEVQAHAATALANLAYGSPSYQSEAGEAGAIGALLDVCRGRAGSGGGNAHDGTSTAVPLEVEEEEELSNDRRKVSENASVVGKLQEKNETGERWARKRQDVDRPVPTTVSTDTAVARIVGAQNEARKENEVDEEELECDGEKRGEEGRTTETMDVDAVQAATSALANLLCYSDANGVRLVAAAGIGVLVGLVSSYKPHNLLDFDQVGACVWALPQYVHAKRVAIEGGSSRRLSFLNCLARFSVGRYIDRGEVSILHDITATAVLRGGPMPHTTIISDKGYIFGCHVIQSILVQRILGQSDIYNVSTFNPCGQLSSALHGGCMRFLSANVDFRRRKSRPTPPRPW